MAYCTVEQVLGLIKEDMQNTIIGDEYIEDAQEKQDKITKLCQDAIEDACAEIDGYLGKRYNVPFAKTPQSITKFAKDIAAYNLVSRVGVDESDRDKTFLTRYNSAIKFLLEAAKGTINVGTEETGENQREAEAGFRLEHPPRLFSRDSMGGW